MWWLALILAGADLDGDGCDDVVLADRGPGQPVRILSGRTGEILERWAHTEHAGNDDVAVSLVAGGDGVAEVLRVDSQTGRAVWFTPDGMFLRHLRGRRPPAEPEERHPLVCAQASDGSAVFVRGGLVISTGSDQPQGVGVGPIGAIDHLDDVNGDGVRDLVVGRPLARDGQGCAEVLSGREGERLLALENRVGGRFGTSVAAVGDVDGDGVVDIAVGAPHGVVEEHSPDVISDGVVVVFSGVDGQVLYELAPESTFDPFTRFGAAIVPIGDVDDDERGDFAVSAYKHDPMAHETQRGSVAVYSGATGVLRFEVFGPCEGVGYFGYRLRSPGDSNGDGVDDLLVWGSEGWTLLSGADGALVWHAGDDDERGTSDGWVVRRLDGRGERSLRLVRPEPAGGSGRGR